MDAQHDEHIGPANSIDPSLIEKISRGDQHAFAEFFHAFRDKVYNVAFIYLKKDSYAQEVVQDVFLRAWNHRAKLPEIVNPEAWLHTVTKNRCITVLRKIITDEKRITEFSLSYLPEATEEAFANDERKMNQLLNEALSRLTPQQRKAFEMAKLQGMKREEVAEALGLSVNTVNNHLNAAVRIVRAFLQQRSELIIIGLMLICAEA